MPVFTYRAADRRGQTIDGVMEAVDARAVVERLRKEAYFPIKVLAQGERAPLFSLGGGSRVRQRDLLALTQMLATLFEAGLPLDRALSILEELAPSPRVKSIVTDLLHSVRGGSSLSEALAKHHPRPFSRLYINMVRAGEKGGVLEVSLRRLAEFLEARAAFNEAVVSALAYPLVITTVPKNTLFCSLSTRTYSILAPSWSSADSTVNISPRAVAVPPRDLRRSTGFTSTQPRMSAPIDGSTLETGGLRRTT